MSTVFVDFAPSNTAPFQFQPVLDGLPCTAIVTWNLFSQRWYISVFTAAGALMVSQAMVGSPNGYDISLTAGYTATKLVYRAPSNKFEVIS